MLLYNCDQIIPAQHRLLVFAGPDDARAFDWPEKEREHISQCIDNGQRIIQLHHLEQSDLVLIPDPAKQGDSLLEAWRNDGFDIHELACRQKWQELVLFDRTGRADWVEAISEGIALSNYQFLKYFTKADEKRHSFSRLGILNGDPIQIRHLNARLRAVCLARDLVNEPVSYLNAPQLALDLTEMCLETGISVEVLDKTQIESLRMGGLLGVNRGSIDPPRFIILTWEPEQAVNTDPLVLVGKGITFDTGGLTIKPTPGSMDEMKSDMAGAAAVAGTLIGAARMGLPVKIIGLIPATDNRPDGNAITPGDILRMHNNTTVEVLNTDAEGRLILADALSYASRYKPGLVVDMATLTGSAQVALGSQAAAVMGTAPEEVFETLMRAGFAVHERVVRFPLWAEYGKMIESEIADLKNIGNRYAGLITAGKFLEHFTSYPWIHIDIAGTAYLTSREEYRGLGGTGSGVRLMLDFISKYYQL